MADINLLEAIPLGKIQNWSDKKTVYISPISFPGEDSGKSEAIDTLGTIQTIEITGKITGTFSFLQNTISSIKLLANGFQNNDYILQSPFINSNFYTTTLASPKIEVKQLRKGNIGINTGTLSTVIDADAHFLSWNIQPGDVVKNLNTDTTANVTLVPSDFTIILDNSIMTAGCSYAVTATIHVKITDFEVNWEIPGLSYVEYKLSVIQVK